MTVVDPRSDPVGGLAAECLETPRRRGRPPKPKLPESIDVLVIEDDPDLTQVLADELEAFGYKVGLAYTVESAREALRLRRPRLIFLDLNLGDGRGEDVVGYARALGITLPPIYVLSGYRDARRIQACGAVGALYKPETAIEMVSGVAERLLGPVAPRRRRAL